MTALSPKTSWCLRWVLLLEQRDENTRGGAVVGHKLSWDIPTMRARRWGDGSWKAVVVRWRDRREEDWGGGYSCASALFKLLGSLLLLRVENSLQILLSRITGDRLLWNSVCQISHRQPDTDAPFFFRRDNWHNSISVPMSPFTWLRESLMMPTKRPQKS